MIGEKTITKMQEILSTLLYEYSGSIDDTFTANEGELAISLGMKLVQEGGSVKCTGTISFPTGRVQDKIEEKVDEEQGNLFDSVDE
jgi:hypothetical protein